MCEASRICIAGGRRNKDGGIFVEKRTILLSLAGCLRIGGKKRQINMDPENDL